MSHLERQGYEIGQALDWLHRAKFFRVPRLEEVEPVKVGHTPWPMIRKKWLWPAFDWPTWRVTKRPYDWEVDQ